MQAKLLTNHLLKTVEYKIEDQDRLQISTISIHGASTRDVLIKNIKRTEGKSIPTFVSWLVLSLGCSLILSSYFYSQQHGLIANNLLSIVSFLGCITASLFFICKPQTIIRYKDKSTNKTFLKIKKYSIKKPEEIEFNKALDNAINIHCVQNTDNPFLIKKANIQYQRQHKHVNELFNLGLIDENLYDRICNSMQENLFGTESTKVTTDNVIYLNK